MLKNNKGTILLMTILIMAGMLTIAVASASLVLSGIRMGGTQARSTKAFFAAEAGAEKILWSFRKNLLDPWIADTPDGQYSGCVSGHNFCFDKDNSYAIVGCASSTNADLNDDCDDIPGALPGYVSEHELTNESKYSILYLYSCCNSGRGTTTMRSIGEYKGTRRVIEIRYPD